MPRRPPQSPSRRCYCPRRTAATADGTLTFTPAPDASGPATIGVVARDSGVAIAAVSGTYNMIHPDGAIRADGFARPARIRLGLVTYNLAKDWDWQRRRFVACHELGHAIGLGHRPELSSRSCMVTGFSRVSVSPAIPDDTDLANLAALYA